MAAPFVRGVARRPRLAGSVRVPRLNRRPRNEERRALGAMLSDDGHTVTQATRAAPVEAVEAVGGAPFDLVITAQNLPDGKGLQLLSACRDADPALPVVILTAFATVELAVEALRRGRVRLPDQALHARRGARRGRPGRRASRPAARKPPPARRGRPPRLHVRTARRQPGDAGGQGANRARRADRRDGPDHRRDGHRQGAGRPCGPPGEQPVRRALSCGQLRARSRTACSTASCSATSRARSLAPTAPDPGGSRPPTAERSSSTRRGDVASAAGEAAARVDEPAHRPRRLTRVAVGGRAADPRDPPRPEGPGRFRRSFREDLYYRVAVVPVDMPPLRDRAEDIPQLVERFLTATAQELKVPRRGLSPAAMDKLCNYPFPGNIRELRNLIERASILAQGPTICPSDFPLGGDGDPGGAGAGAHAEDDPIRLCVRALPPVLEPPRDRRPAASASSSSARWRRAAVSRRRRRRLNLSRGDVGYKIRKHGMPQRSDHDGHSAHHAPFPTDAGPD